ncbi:hypothetical protein AMJ40_02565 [candidate division TA06 bacterium DG_26]|uniref:PTS EIIA type-2 domain-containing protein n=1 Tax=candidate division TA06 bacterium DG_26 TaxID=1703771 RepID=A0A0S7WK56_UNCT6|nr:MAG: hypothetical protein AMJ40_02565 [candidate division TA06 bacterium DG_26]
MLSELLSPETIAFPLHASRKESIIEELVGLAVAGGAISHKKEVVQRVKEREEILSTTVGKGVFIPRVRSRHVSRICLCLGITRKALDLGALDGNHVRLCVFLGIPEGKIEAQVKYLVRIFRLFNQDSFRSALLKAADKKDVIEIVRSEERDLER